eukprot:scpid80643/ scgid27748/ 
MAPVSLPWFAPSVVTGNHRLVCGRRHSAAMVQPSSLSVLLYCSGCSSGDGGGIVILFLDALFPPAECRGAERLVDIYISSPGFAQDDNGCERDEFVDYDDGHA